MALYNPAQTLPATSRDALDLFDERYNALRLVAPEPTWVDQLGEVHTTPALETRYPMSLLALKYLESKSSDARFKTIGEKDVTLTVAEYKDGVEIELIKLLTNTFSAARWADAPQAMIEAEAQFKAYLIADMLVANTETCGWDDLALFHDSHLANLKDASLGTFDNLQATTKDVADLSVLEAEITLMMEVKDMNGDVLGVEPDTIMVPRQKFQKLKNLLKQDFVPSAAGTATMRNPYNDAGLTVVLNRQLSDNNDWYMADSKLIAKGAAPWTLAKLAIAAPGFDSLSLRRYDESSPYFNETGKIAVSSHIYYGTKFLYPHAIRKIAGA